MSLVPRWRYMTDEAKALTKRTAVSALVVLMVLLVFRALVPWMLVAVVAWWIWKAVSGDSENWTRGDTKTEPPGSHRDLSD
jgi:hypothetical protein